MNLETLPRVSLAALPTPVQPLPRLSRALGRTLWIKRDDLTGLALGGNKTRKLELLCADALGSKADTLITCGAPQSNHCRQTAAAAAKLGLRCVLVLSGEPQPADFGKSSPGCAGRRRTGLVGRFAARSGGAGGL